MNVEVLAAMEVGVDVDCIWYGRRGQAHDGGCFGKERVLFNTKILPVSFVVSAC